MRSSGKRISYGGVVAALCCGLLVLAAGPVAAGDDDHEIARRALEAGEVLPLRTVLDIVEKQYPGQVVEVEFEHDDGEFQYEIKVLQQGGRLVTLDLDARTGEIVEAKSRQRD